MNLLLLLLFFFKLCQGGSVTDLVHGLKNQNKQLTEDQIAYILHETLQVHFINLKLIIYSI